MSNKLINETSPYLLQHANNPVNWYPWGNEAFQKAKSEKRPIFLSIGYSTCHWCHVMERECFEDEEVAKMLNDNFVSIKVDREERPDIDSIYMEVCSLITGHGGWPLSIFMLPDMKPFFAGTYFPKHDSLGRPGFMTILTRVKESWSNKKDVLTQSANQITKALNEPIENFNYTMSLASLDEAYYNLRHDFDPKHGGFGNAPKFPTVGPLMFLLRYYYINSNPNALDMVTKTLDAMYEGGLYDHLGYGFYRYSTDRNFLAPHFEKMLYTNALLAITYCEAYQITKKENYKMVAEQILEYIKREMLDKNGGFYSALDADSEGIEGKFYTWKRHEVVDVLGQEDGDKLCNILKITEKGNFEDTNIINFINIDIPQTEKAFIKDSFKKMFYARDKREHPFLDDKVLTSWNALAIWAFCFCGRVFKNYDYIQTATNAYNFIENNLIKEGRLYASYRNTVSSQLGFLDDYSYLTYALLELYESTYDPKYLESAVKLSKNMVNLFLDSDKGGLFLYANDSENLITRPKEIYDGAMPSGNAMAILSFIKLARITTNQELEDLASEILDIFSPQIIRAPQEYCFSLMGLQHLSKNSKEIVFVDNKKSKQINDMIQTLREDFRPFTISMLYNDENKDIINVIPSIKDYIQNSNDSKAYVCQDYSCNQPVSNVEDFKNLLS